MLKFAFMAPACSLPVELLHLHFWTWLVIRIEGVKIISINYSLCFKGTAKKCGMFRGDFLLGILLATIKVTYVIIR
jgi:hypothetical protein